MARLRLNCVRIAASVAVSRVKKAFAMPAIWRLSILTLALGASLVLTIAAVAGPTATPTITPTATPTVAGPTATPTATPTGAGSPLPPPAAPDPTPTPTVAGPPPVAPDPTATPTATPSASGQITAGVGGDLGRILEILRSGKSANVIVTFEVSEIRVEARNRASAKGLLSLGPDELAYKRDAYASVKQKGLSGLDGVAVLRDYEGLSASFVRVSNEETLNSLLARAEVKAVHENRRLQLALDESLPLIKHQNVVAQGLDGTGTVVAVFDTGVNYDNDYFKCTEPGESGCRIRATLESTFNPFTGDPTDDGSLDDGYGHGTHVSTIVATVAGAADLVVADVDDEDWGITEDNVIYAMSWIIMDLEALNIVAVNLSFFYPSHEKSACEDDLYEGLAEDALEAGIQPIACSGNAAYEDGAISDGLSFPACVNGIVSVGAVYDDEIEGGFQWGDPEEGKDLYDCFDEETETGADKVPCFSQAADYLDLLAPGSKITAEGVTKSGTSFAAPHVSGAWAIMREAWPSKTEAEILTILQDDGKVVTDTRLASGDRDFKRLDFLPEPSQLPVLSSGILALWGLSFLRARDRGLGRRLG